MQIYIYALYAPDTEQAFYIGQSNDPVKRASTHFADGKRLYHSCMSVYGYYGHGRKPHKEYRIADLITKGMKPELKILETCKNRQQALQREKYWIIVFLQAGHPLANCKSEMPSKAMLEKIKNSKRLVGSFVEVLV